MMTVYVEAASKKAANEQLKNGHLLEAQKYSIFGDSCHVLNYLPTGTVVKIYSKIVMGSPYAKSYGTYNQEKNIIK